MLVIPALWEAEAGGSPEIRSLRPAWPTWQNPVSTKNTKFSWAWWYTCLWSHLLGSWCGRIPGAWDVQAVVSHDCMTALQPRQHSKDLSKKKIKSKINFLKCCFIIIIVDKLSGYHGPDKLTYKINHHRSDRQHLHHQGSLFKTQKLQQWQAPGTCKPNYTGSWGRRVTWGREFKTSLGSIAEPHLEKIF